MQKFNYSVGVPAKSKAEAEAKLKAAMRLMKSFDPKTLQALAAKGPAIFNGPDGAFVKSYLGLA